MNTSDINTPEKEAAVGFQQMVVSGKVREAYEKYIHSDFIHHNPYFAGDRTSLMNAMEDNAGQFPNKIFEPQKIVQEKDIVVIYSRLKLSPEMPEMATMHMFRFQDGLIIEEWDLGQQIPAENLNKYGMF